MKNLFKVAIIGLGFSHPYTYAKILKKLNIPIFEVYDENYNKVIEFKNEFNVKKVLNNINNIQSDIVFLEIRPDKRMQIARELIKQDKKVFIDKPIGVNLKEINSFLEEAKKYNCIIFTSSAITYAPKFIEWKNKIKKYINKPNYIKVEVAHNMIEYLKPEQKWQDMPLLGGGEYINWGIHGIEPIFDLFDYNYEAEIKFKYFDKIYYKSSNSQDISRVVFTINKSIIDFTLFSFLEDYYFKFEFFSNIFTASILIKDEENVLKGFGFENQINDFFTCCLNKKRLNLAKIYKRIEKVYNFLLLTKIVGGKDETDNSNSDRSRG